MSWQVHDVACRGASPPPTVLALHRIGLHNAILSVPAMTRLLARTQLLTNPRDRLPTGQQSIRFTQRRDNLIRRATLSAICTHRESPGPPGAERLS
jgi:hypothetical protein